MNEKKKKKAIEVARDDAVVYGSGFYNSETGERIDPKDVIVTKLSNGSYMYTYGKMKPENIKVTIESKLY